MATPYSVPVTAAQVGSYFVGQYYQILQQQPEFVHQLYSNASTMIRIDGNTREAASGLLQIHTLVMSLKQTRIELKTAHSLESWNGGVLVMVSGSLHINGFNERRNFVQTFFLAPQENGYFILNDIFHFIEEERTTPHHATFLSQPIIDPKPNHTPTYMLCEKIQPKESNGYQVEKVSETPKLPEDNGSLQKHTYASIVRSSSSKAPPVQEVSEPSTQREEEDYAAMEDEMEVKSVYVKNVPTTMDPCEIEEEFKKFGKLRPDGVAIRTRKDFDACYAFVEFEDMISVQNAIKASYVEINGHQLYIEGRRPNRNSLYRGRGRGRGRSNGLPRHERASSYGSRNGYNI